MSCQEQNQVSVLLVEDDDVAAEVVERALKKCNAGADIYHVWDGVEALEVLNDRHPKITLPKPYTILLDLNMPRMGGLEFLQELRADPALRKSVVFVLSTSDRESDKYAAYDNQIAGYILKSAGGEDFSKVTEMLDNYWDVVALPDV